MRVTELLRPTTSKRVRRGFTENEKTKPCPCCKGGTAPCSHGKSVCGTCNGKGTVPVDHETKDNDC